MIVRLTKTGERRTVTASQAKQLIEAKQAVPVIENNHRFAVIPTSRVERR